MKLITQNNMKKSITKNNEAQFDHHWRGTPAVAFDPDSQGNGAVHRRLRHVSNRPGPAGG